MIAASALALIASDLRDYYLSGLTPEKASEFEALPSYAKAETIYTYVSYNEGFEIYLDGVSISDFAKADFLAASSSARFSALLPYVH